MTNIPEDEAREPVILPESDPAGFGATPAFDAAQEHIAAPSYSDANIEADPAASTQAAPAYSYVPPTSPEPPLFHSFAQPPVRRPARIPNFGHLLLLSLLIIVAFSILIIALALAAHFHLYGFRLSQKSATDLGFNLLSEGVLYLVTFGLSLFVFPMVWNESLFAGLQWRGTVALSRFWLLVCTALACFGLAILDQVLMPGPSNSPIEKMINSPGAAWMMFVFGVTLAPFFEEMLFRGFLLPSLCTACDWIAEKMHASLPRPLDANGHPQWSLPAMIIGAVLTSIPFAGLHVEQQGHSLGPFLLLIVVSLILCTVRLFTRSLAASTLVHASYNFFIFASTLAATGGFRHFDKM
jgi:membrane protease YdiL (CAAX protease family)